MKGKNGIRESRIYENLLNKKQYYFPSSEAMALEIVTLAIGIFALVVSILVFIDSRSKTKILREQNEDNRKKTEIMENQLKLLQAQSESKQDIRNALTIIEGIEEGINKFDPSLYNWGDFGKIAPQRLLEMLHDSGNPNLIWGGKPYAIFGTIAGHEEYGLSRLKTFDAFKVFFETMVPKTDTNFTIRFISTPKIELDSERELQDILVKDYVKDIYSLKLMIEELKRVEKVVNMYDCALVSDMQNTYLKILNSLFDAMSKGYTLDISSQIKAKELPNHLTKFISLDVWQGCVNELKKNFKSRLFEISRQLRESA